MAMKKIRMTLRTPGVGLRTIRGADMPKVKAPTKGAVRMVTDKSLKKSVANKLGRKRFGPLSKRR